MAAKTVIIHNAATTDLRLSMKFSTIRAGNVGKTVWISNPDRSHFLVQVNGLKTFGIDAPYCPGGEEPSAKDPTKKEKETFSLRFPPDVVAGTGDEAMVQLFKNLSLMDEHLVETAQTEKDWFPKGKKVTTADVIRAQMTPLIKHQMDSNGDPVPNRDSTIKVKLYPGKYDIFDSDRNLIFPNGDVSVSDVLPSNSVLNCILRFTMVWFVSGRFGFTVEAVNIQVAKTTGPSQLKRGHCYIMGENRSVEEASEAIAEIKHVMTEDRVRSDEGGTKTSRRTTCDVEDSDSEKDPDGEYR
jgi:hypothetical protein